MLNKRLVCAVGRAGVVLRGGVQTLLVSDCRVYCDTWFVRLFHGIGGSVALFHSHFSSVLPKVKTHVFLKLRARVSTKLNE